MIYKHFVLLIAMTALISCCNVKRDVAVSIITLAGKTMENNDPDFFLRNIIDIKDSLLYAYFSQKNTNIINVYRIKEDSLILYHRFLNWGNGPYEITMPVCIYDKTTETISFFENIGKLMRGYQIDLKELKNIDDKSTWRVFNFLEINDIRFRHGFAYVSDTLLLAIGGMYDDRNILTIINLNDMKSTYPLEFWPNDGYKTNTSVKQAVYMDNARLYKNHKLNKFLYVSGNGKYMEVFRISNNQIVDRLPVCNLYPKYIQQGSSYSIKNEETNQGYYVYVSDTLIYARPIEYTMDMFRSRQNNNGYDLNYSNKINIYDWNGNLLKKYEMDVPFYSFVVDEENNVIYVETDNLITGKTIIRKYNTLQIM